MKWMVSSSHSMWHNLPEPESECPAAHSLAAEGAVLTVTAGSRLAGRSAAPTPVSDSWRITSSLTPVLLLDRRPGTAVWSEPQRAEASRNSRTHASGPAHSQNSCRSMLYMRAPLMKRMDLGIPWTKESSGDYCEQCGSFHQCQAQQQSHSADLFYQILTHSSH